MPFRKAAGVVLALCALFVLYLRRAPAPLLRWVIEGAKLVHAHGLARLLATFAATYA